MRKIFTTTLGLAALAFSSVSFGADFLIEGKTLKQALAEISAVAGTTYLPAANVENEVVYIRAKGVDAPDVLKKIAEATGLSWAQEGSTYVLGMYRDSKSKLRAESTLVQGLRLEANMKSVAERYERGPDYDYSKAYLEQLAETGGRGSRTSRTQPIQDSISWILRSEKGIVLSAMEPNTRVVFSTQPTTKQKRMSAAMNQAINRGATQYRQLLATMISAISKQTGANSNNALTELQSFYSRPIAKANLVVTLKNGVYGFQLQYVDAQGATIEMVGGPTVGIDGDALPTGWTAFQWPNVSQTKSPVLLNLAIANTTFDRTVRYRDLTIDVQRDALRKSVVNPIPFAAGVDMSSVSALLDPVGTDPVGKLANEFLTSLPGDKIVAVVPDSVGPRLGGALLTGNTPKILAGSADVVSETLDGWTVLRPADRYMAIKTRVDRDALKTLFLAMSRNYGFASIADLTSYANQTPEGVPLSGLDVALTNWLFEKESADTVAGTHSDGWYDHKIFLNAKNMSGLMRLSAAAGLTLPLNDDFYFSIRGPSSARSRQDYLASNGTNISLDTTLLGGNQAIEIRRNTEYIASQELSSNLPLINVISDSLVAQGRPQVVRPDERTDRIPYGLPASGQLNVSNRDQTLFLAIDKTSGRKILYSTDSYARLLALANFGGSKTYPASAEVFDDFLPVVIESRDLQLEIEPGYVLISNISGTRITGSPTPYEKMPDSMRREIDRRYLAYDKEYSERMQRSNGGDDRRRNGGGRIIPPTP